MMNLKLIILIVLTLLTSIGLIVSIGLSVNFARHDETFVPGWRATYGLITNITTHNVTVEPCVKSNITVLTPLCNNTLIFEVSFIETCMKPTGYFARDSLSESGPSCAACGTCCSTFEKYYSINKTIDCFVDHTCKEVTTNNDHPDRIVLNENDTYSFYMGCTGLVLLMCLYSLCTFTGLKLQAHWNEKKSLRTLSIDRIPLKNGSHFSVV